MSLFSRLLYLRSSNIPLEDFFTEIVAYFFDKNPEILCSWLKDSHVLDACVYSNVNISTQRKFQSIESQDSHSRPDIVIELADGDFRDIVFIESKIASSEGGTQLQRYAKILDSLVGFRNKILVYITREFDPKNKRKILEKIPDASVEFCQLRWHEFYRFLIPYSHLTFVKEIISFMQDNRMTSNNQFSSIDIITLANFTKSLRLMEEVMHGEVRRQFSVVLGGVGKRNAALTQLQNHGRYIMSTGMPKGWWCGLGFRLETSAVINYPTVFLNLEVAPTSICRDDIIKEMKIICKEYSCWQDYNLYDSKAWSGISKEKTLQEFISQEDHVSAIQNFFFESLKELEKIKQEFPHLPWGAIPDLDNDTSSYQ